MRRIVVVALTSLGLLMAAGAATAQADSPFIGLSRDGVTWSSSLDGPLFDTDMRWVPGDSETSMFFVRNDYGTDGELALDILAGDGAQSLFDSGDLRVSVQIGGERQTVSSAEDRRLIDDLDVANGDVADIEVNVSLDSASTSRTQLSSASFAFRVTLSGAVDDVAVLGESEVAGVGGVTDGRVNDALPDTGASVTWWLLALAAALLGSGTALVTDRRREACDG